MCPASPVAAVTTGVSSHYLNVQRLLLSLMCLCAPLHIFFDIATCALLYHLLFMAVSALSTDRAR